MLYARFKVKGEELSGILKGDTVVVLDGNGNEAKRYPLGDVELLTPSEPTKVIALWNNYRALADKNKLIYPDTPLYLFKPPNTWLATEQTIKHPPAYEGKVFFEGELGIVIGKQASNIAAGTGEDYIAGYTCINDVTAFDLLKEYSGFDQWSRAKGFDTFGVMGPVIADDVDWQDLVITTRINGEAVQQYPASDMLMSPERVVYELSKNMTLYPGDVICCGTSIGLGPMPLDCTVEVEIKGIGCLRNRYTA